LLDAGNLDSPPDTAFVVEAMGAALLVARRRRNDTWLARMQEMLSQFLQRVGDGVVTGGIHTPNHRWVVCAALARLHALFPNGKYVARIDDWLGEGIYQDADGLFPERSPNYARVEVDAFVTLARLLNRPALLDPVRKHLNANLYLLQPPDGEIECVNSRRQDQDRAIHVANFYLQYRYMAIRDNNATFAAVARLIAARPGEGLVEGVNPVIYFLEDPAVLRKSLPEGGAIPSDYSKVFANSQMVRIRRGDRAATIFGGRDGSQGKQYFFVGFTMDHCECRTTPFAVVSGARRGTEFHSCGGAIALGAAGAQHADPAVGGATRRRTVRGHDAQGGTDAGRTRVARKGSGRVDGHPAERRRSWIVDAGFARELAFGLYAETPAGVRGGASPFAAERPNVSVSIRNVAFDDPTGGVLSRKCDVSLVWEPFLTQGLTCERLFSDERVAMLAADHPLLASEGALSAEALAQEPFVWVDDMDPVARDFWTLAEQRGGRPPRIGARITGFEDLFAAVRAGQAVAACPASIAAGLPWKDLTTRPVQGLPPVQVALCWRAEDRNAVVNAFIDCARRLAAELMR
jgi:DNA-binding transcriptional LysR family regulator